MTTTTHPNNRNNRIFGQQRLWQIQWIGNVSAEHGPSLCSRLSSRLAPILMIAGGQEPRTVARCSTDRQRRRIHLGPWKNHVATFASNLQSTALRTPRMQCMCLGEERKLRFLLVSVHRFLRHTTPRLSATFLRMYQFSNEAKGEHEQAVTAILRSVVAEYAMMTHAFMADDARDSNTSLYSV